MFKCDCCGKVFRQLPDGAFMCFIGGWHKVRLKTINDISGTTEIGCGNTPDEAARDAYNWLKENADNPIYFKKTVIVEIRDDYGSKPYGPFALDEVHQWIEENKLDKRFVEIKTLTKNLGRHIRRDGH